MTGIDRVEFAYLMHLLSLDDPVFGLVRSAAGWQLLNRQGCEGLVPFVLGERPLGPVDMLSRLTIRRNPVRARAEATARDLAFMRRARPFLARVLRHVPRGAEYFNVGHANLTQRGLAALRRAGLRVNVLIHDTIPLDHPEFARPDSVVPFQDKLAAVSAHADRVIHITNAARANTEAHLARMGRVPFGITANIGVALPKPDPGLLPPGIDLSKPYFVTLGTIEPRKNHKLLLDIWEKLGPTAPRLFIIGTRGWADQSLLSRLDSLPLKGPVRVYSGLDDKMVAVLLSKSRALLAPSLAEGFGLPPLEAAMLGIDVIATDLLVTRELLGDKAVYLDPSDSYSWMETIKRHAQADRPPLPLQDRLRPPTWAAHFNTVLSLG